MRDLSGPGPFTVFAPLSAAFDEEPQVSMKLLASPRGLGLEPRLWVSRWNQHWRHFWAGDLGSTRADQQWNELPLSIQTPTKGQNLSGFGIQ